MKILILLLVFASFSPIQNQIFSQDPILYDEFDNEISSFYLAQEAKGSTATGPYWTTTGNGGKIFSFFEDGEKKYVLISMGWELTATSKTKGGVLGFGGDFTVNFRKVDYREVVVLLKSNQYVEGEGYFAFDRTHTLPEFYLIFDFNAYKTTSKLKQLDLQSFSFKGYRFSPQLTVRDIKYWVEAGQSQYGYGQTDYYFDVYVNVEKSH